MKHFHEHEKPIANQTTVKCLIHELYGWLC